MMTNRKTRHWRKCWDCNHIASYTDNIAPEVCCKRCRSQDTRPTKEEGCILCGGFGVVDSGGSTPWGTFIDVPCQCQSKETL